MTTTLDAPCKINTFGGTEILKDIGTLALVAKWRFWAEFSPRGEGAGGRIPLPLSIKIPLL